MSSTVVEFEQWSLDLQLLPQKDINQRKQDFLSRLVGNGKSRYTRYRGLPLRYAGGKSLAVGHVIGQLPDGLNRLASPFFGGGSVEIAYVHELGMGVQGYERIGQLLVGSAKKSRTACCSAADLVAKSRRCTQWQRSILSPIGMK